MYLFGQAAPGGARYVFLKLESSAALSFDHAHGAFMRYVLKSERWKQASGVPARRENDWKNGVPRNRSARIARASAEDLKAWKWAPRAAEET